MVHVLCNFIGTDIKGGRYDGLNAAVNTFFSSFMDRVVVVVVAVVVVVMVHVLCNFIGTDIKGGRYDGLNAAVNTFFSSFMDRVRLYKDVEWRKWASAPRIGN